jgi:hypothetical protein
LGKLNFSKINIFLFESFDFFGMVAGKLPIHSARKKGDFFTDFWLRFFYTSWTHTSHTSCVLIFFADTATLEYLHRCPIVTLVSKYLRRGVSHIIWRQQQGWNWPELPVCPKIESFLQF